MPAEGKWVSYLRVSTGHQGRSGFGLEAQRTAVADYLNGGSWELAKEFVEVESGENSDRPVLAEAIKACRLYGREPGYRGDRSARPRPHFLLCLEKAGVDFVAVYMPAANRLTVGIMAMVADEERRMILAAAKKRGVNLGGYRPGAKLTAKARKAGHEEMRAPRGSAQPIWHRPSRKSQAAGATSLRAIADRLNDLKIPTARVNTWSPVQVASVLASAVKIVGRRWP